MIATVRRGALFALTVCALALPATARAESVTPVPHPDSSARAAAIQGPTVTAAAVAVQPRQAQAEAAVMQSRAGLGKPRALMFVGLGTFIAGAIIGGDPGTVIMIAGAGIGLYGLYQYLQ